MVEALSAVEVVKTMPSLPTWHIVQFVYVPNTCVQNDACRARNALSCATELLTFCNSSI